MKPSQREEMLEKFDRISVWNRGSERAPHKPLLILYTLARWQRGEKKSLHFIAGNRIADAGFIEHCQSTE